MTKTIFATRLAQIRKQNCHTQQELADILSTELCREKKLSLLAVSGWESGDKFPPMETVLAICSCYNISPNYLLGYSDEPRCSTAIEDLEVDHKVKKRLNMAQLQNKKSSDRIWIEMETPSEQVKQRYNGWYRLNETKTDLINATGYVLPLDGLDINYHAYTANQYH